METLKNVRFLMKYGIEMGNIPPLYVGCMMIFGEAKDSHIASQVGLEYLTYCQDKWIESMQMQT